MRTIAAGGVALLVALAAAPAGAGGRVEAANVQFRPVLATLPPSTAAATAPLTNADGVVGGCDVAAVVAEPAVPTSFPNRADRCVVLEQGPPGEGARLYLGPAALDGDGVRHATGGTSRGSGQAVIDLRLTAAGKKAVNRLAADSFEKQAPMNQMAIVVDGNVVAAPTFQQADFPGGIQVSGSFTPREAKTLARRIGASRWLSRFSAASTAEVLESYVGSKEHVEDVKELEAGAPTGVESQLRRVRQYIDDHVDPADPDSQLAARWPAKVRSARESLRRYELEHCR